MPMRTASGSVPRVSRLLAAAAISSPARRQAEERRLAKASGRTRLPDERDDALKRTLRQPIIGDRHDGRGNAERTPGFLHITDRPRVARTPETSWYTWWHVLSGPSKRLQLPDYVDRLCRQQPRVRNRNGIWACRGLKPRPSGCLHQTPSAGPRGAKPRPSKRCTVA